MKVKKENNKIVGFLELLDGSRVDLSYDESSNIVLIDFENHISRMSLKEFKDFVKALETYVKYIENDRKIDI